MSLNPILIQGFVVRNLACFGLLPQLRVTWVQVPAKFTYGCFLATTSISDNASSTSLPWLRSLEVRYLLWVTNCKWPGFDSRRSPFFFEFACHTTARTGLMDGWIQKIKCDTELDKLNYNYIKTTRDNTKKSNHELKTEKISLLYSMVWRRRRQWQ